MSTACTLPYLGQRAYLHGTTLFEALMPHIETWQDVCFKIPAPIRTNTVRICSQAEQEGGHCALMHYTNAEKRQVLYIYPMEMRQPLQREPFDEERLVAQTDFREAEAHFPAIWVDSFVKIAVAVNKALLQRMYSDKTQGQWVFIGLELQEKPTEAPLTLTVRNSIGGGRLVNTQLFLQQKSVGTMLFSYLNSPIG